jgi:hypothetical protein
MQELDRVTHCGKVKYLVGQELVKSILISKNQLDMELVQVYGGYNCRHNFYPYFEGSERAYTDKELSEINNNNVTYNNKNYTEYEAIQMQRKAERNIRATKRELASYQALTECNNEKLRQEAKNKFDITSLKLKQDEKEYRNFIEQTGLTRDRARERVDIFDKSLSKKVEWNNKKIVTNTKKYDTIDVNKIDIEGITEKGRKSLENVYNTTLSHGLKTGNETMLSIDKTTGELVTTKHDGGKSSVQFNDEDIAALTTWPKNKVVCVHNHPSNSSFSDADMRVMVKYESISDLSVIGHGNTIYTLSVDNGERPHLLNISYDYHDIKNTLMPKYMDKIKNGELSKEEAWHEHSNEIVEAIAKKYKWKYRRYELDEK